MYFCPEDLGPVVLSCLYKHLLITSNVDEETFTLSIFCMILSLIMNFVNHWKKIVTARDGYRWTG